MHRNISFSFDRDRGVRVPFTNKNEEYPLRDFWNYLGQIIEFQRNGLFLIMGLMEGTKNIAAKVWQPTVCHWHGGSTTQCVCVGFQA